MNPRQNETEPKTRECVAAAKSEGFASGTSLLDIEEGAVCRQLPRVSRGLVRGAHPRGYHPGVYCSGMPVKETRRHYHHSRRHSQRSRVTRHHHLGLYDFCPPSPGCAFPQTRLAFFEHRLRGRLAIPRNPRAARNSPRMPAKYAPDGNCYSPGDIAHSWFLDVNTATSPDPSGGAK